MCRRWQVPLPAKPLRRGGSMSEAAKHFDDVAAAYAAVASTRPEFAERFAVLRGLVPDARPDGERRPVALDLGCGPGHMTTLLAAAGYDTVAVDGSRAMLDLAEQALRGNRERVSFVHATLPFSTDGSASMPVAAV